MSKNVISMVNLHTEIFRMQNFGLSCVFRDNTEHFVILVGISDRLAQRWLQIESCILNNNNNKKQC